MDDVKLLAFYEIARRADFTDNSNLVKLPAFQDAKELQLSWRGLSVTAFPRFLVMQVANGIL